MSPRRATRRENVDAFVARTDPLVVQAMRKTTGNKAPLTIEEKAALDNWLEPRIDALADRLAEQLGVNSDPAPYGHRVIRRNRKWPTARSARRASNRSDRSTVTTS